MPAAVKSSFQTLEIHPRNIYIYHILCSSCASFIALLFFENVRSCHLNTKYMSPSKTGLPGSDPVSQSQQLLILEFHPTNQLVGSKFDFGDLTLLLIGSACSKDLTFVARGTSELPLTLNFHNTADSKLKTVSRTSGTQGIN